MDRYGREYDEGFLRSFCRTAHFKGGGSSTTVQNTTTYEASPEERQLQALQAQYAKAISPNSLWLNDTARNILQNSIGAVQVDFNGLNKNAQQQIDTATQGLKGLTSSNDSAANTANGLLSGLSPQYKTAANSANSQLASLANGYLPSQYKRNMEDSIRSVLDNTMGRNLNSLANRGVVNSSVTNKAMNDIAENAANTVAQQYANNINTVSNLTNQQLSNTNNALNAQGSLGQQEYQNTMAANAQNAGIYGNLLDSATSKMTTAAAAQEAAQQPAINLWNASLGLNGATTGALAAAAGKGTTNTSSTQTQSGGGGGLFSGLLGGLF